MAKKSKTSATHVASYVKRMVSMGASDIEVDTYIKYKGFSRNSLVDALTYEMEKQEKTGGQEADHGFFDSVIQGLSFGFSDEIGSAMDAGGFDGEEYDQGVAARRYAMEEYERENPGMALTGEILGGAIPGLLTGGIGAATGVGRSILSSGGRRLAATAMAGAGEGALSGAGSSTEGNRLEGAGYGAGLGLGLGAAGHGLTTAAQGVGRWATSPLRSASDAADMKVATALDRDAIPMPKMDAQLALAEQAGKPMGMVDVGGENLRKLARGVQAVPGEGADLGKRELTDRAEGQYGRVMQDVEDAVMPQGVKRTDTMELAEEIMARREEEAAPLYQSAFAEPPLHSTEIGDMLEAPLLKKSVNHARDLRGPGEPEINTKIPLDYQSLHMIKMSLDDQIGASFRGGYKVTGRKLLLQKNKLLDAMDANPHYKRARDIFAGESALLDSLDSGRKFWSKDPRLTTRELAKLSESEKEHYLLGATEAIQSLMDRAADSRDMVKVIFGTRLFRDKLRAVVGDDRKFRSLQDKMEMEASMSQTKGFVLGGSPTARIESEILDLKEMPSILSDLMISGPKGAAVGAVARGVRTLAGRAGNPREKVRDMTADRLFKLKATKQRDYLRNLQKTQERMHREAMQRQRIASGVGMAIAPQGGLLQD